MHPKRLAPVNGIMLNTHRSTLTTQGHRDCSWLVSIHLPQDTQRRPWLAETRPFSEGAVSRDWLSLYQCHTLSFSKLQSYKERQWLAQPSCRASKKGNGLHSQAK